MKHAIPLLLTAAFAQPIPLCPGLTIVTAISQPEGDYESIKTVTSAGPGGVQLKYAAERPAKDGPARVRRLNILRTVLVEDLLNARLYLQEFNDRAPIKVPGTTAVGVSSAVLHALKSRGQAELAIFDSPGGQQSADRNSHPSVFDYESGGSLRRIGTVRLPIAVNGVKTELNAIHAKGEFGVDKAEFFFLDDEKNPLALRFRIGKRDTLDVVRITHPCAAEASLLSRLEKSLAETGRADVYEIYFSFNSDVIREESEPVLKEIAGILVKHPDWKLRVEGHTDSVASDAYNLDLSNRRAAAVTAALTGRFKVATARLASSGAGESRPKDTNETLAGRARNRRVELIRIP
jgi:outer membrane protein OmpA-like peptidoglycan-associated protein